MATSRKYLDPETIARLHGLELRARGVVAGFISGMHRSAYRGYSVEFAEHRQYAPGDDIRHLDWRIFGRADKFFIKQFEEETNLRCNVLLDVSRSMGFAGRGRSKLEYGCTLTACLAYLLTQQHDAAGLVTFDAAVRARLPCRTGRAHLADVLHTLDGLAPAGETDVKVLFHRLAEELQHRSTVVLISDLLTDIEDVVSGIGHICLAGHELIVLHVLDDAEWNFPYSENILFEGIEDDLRLLTDPQSLRRNYLAAVERFVTRVRATCLRHGADYVPVNTMDAPAVVLGGYLGARTQRAIRGRK
ncbi:MAG: DUF58 domain-containing protein [Phycisphaerales bacterium]|nr:DUF58 domain-containing protein [Phycisphaerales bacterium]